MAHLTERQLLELADDRAFRQREIRRNINLFNTALGQDARTGYVRRPIVWNDPAKFPDWSFSDDTPDNFVAEDPISFFGIKEVV